MSDQSPPHSPGAAGPQRRRSSFAELFNPRSAISTSASSSPPSAPISSSVPAPQHRRGMSITTFGLAGNNPNPTSPYTAFAKQRRASISTSSGSGSPEFRNSFGDEPAVLEEDDQTRVPLNTPATPSFARRVSFGAQALWDVRQGGSVGAPGGGEGFNWSEALRDRTKRSPSISSSANPFTANTTRSRAASAAAPEPPKEMPKPVTAATPSKLKKPDHLGERMLRGDFMMD